MPAALPGFDMESAAAFLVFEREDLLSAPVEKQAAALGWSIPAVRDLWRDGDFRAVLDRYLTLRVLDPETRRRQLERLVGVSLEAEKDADSIKAFDVLSRQAGLKVPERHEVDDRRSVEITVRELPAGEGGFVPSVPFVEPQSRRAFVGRSVERALPGGLAAREVGARAFVGEAGEDSGFEEGEDE